MYHKQGFGGLECVRGDQRTLSRQKSLLGSIQAIGVHHGPILGAMHRPGNSEIPFKDVSGQGFWESVRACWLILVFRNILCPQPRSQYSQRRASSRTVSYAWHMFHDSQNGTYIHVKASSDKAQRCNRLVHNFDTSRWKEVLTAGSNSR